MTKPKKSPKPAPKTPQPSPPAWIPCVDCGNFWCRIHELHAHDCDCPAIEEWGDVDPYSDPWPPTDAFSELLDAYAAAVLWADANDDEAEGERDRARAAIEYQVDQLRTANADLESQLRDAEEELGPLHATAAAALHVLSVTDPEGTLVAIFYEAMRARGYVLADEPEREHKPTSNSRSSPSGKKKAKRGVVR